MPGIKHLIECHCILAIYRTGKLDPVTHKFSVYSKLDIHDKLVPKLSKCNNCDTMHYVYDVCSSEIRPGKDQSSLSLTIDDLSLMLPERLSNTLMKIETDISNWEHIIDIIEEERWDENVVLRRDIIDERQHVKIIQILSEDRFKMQNQVIDDLLG